MMMMMTPIQHGVQVVVIIVEKMCIVRVLLLVMVCISMFTLGLRFGQEEFVQHKGHSLALQIGFCFIIACNDFIGKMNILN